MFNKSTFSYFSSVKLLPILSSILITNKPEIPDINVIKSPINTASLAPYLFAILGDRFAFKILPHRKKEISNAYARPNS